MDITFDVIKAKVIHLLADDVATGSDEYGGGPLYGSSYDANLLRDAVHAALDAITIKMWKPQTFDIAGSISEKDLPDGLLAVEGVYDKTAGIYLPHMNLQANQESLIGIAGNAWSLFPHGKISFINDLGESGAKVYYSSVWNKPEAPDEVIEPPESSTIAICLYAASYCLLNKSAGSADIRQYNTKVDSGAPTDIPQKTMSDFFYRRYELELQRLPSMEKGNIR